jgi:hypothetical protein
MFPMLRVGFALLFGLTATVVPMPAQTPSAADLAAQLASRISSLLPRGTTVSLEFQNLSALSPAESSSFRGALPDELRKAGVEIAATGRPESRLRISASENVHGRLVIAEILTGETRQVAMLPWSAAPGLNAKPRITIAKKPIWQQPEPILDVLLFDSDAGLLVLSTGKVASYRWIDGKWTPNGLASFSPPRPVARDPRGRIEMLGAGFRVHLPGATCTGELVPALKVVCSPGDAAFPTRWIIDRNLMEASGVRGAFYSEANGLYATADGKITDRTGQPYSGADAWGSDIAAIANPCPPHAGAVIADAAGDDPSRDQIQVFEIADGHATPASEPMTLAGQVTALRPEAMVVRNPKTGEYEAYRLDLACSE